MPSLRRTLATSTHPSAKLARRVYHGIDKVSLPIPVVITRPLIWIYFAINGVYRFLKRVFLAEPYFKSMCRSYGRNVHTGVFLHWITGKGDIVLGDNVKIDGKCSFQFAARFSDRPTLAIGTGTGIGHQCAFTVGKRITIGKDCRIASGTWMFDAGGHPSDPAARLAGLPPSDDEVKPITIGDNVWIGRNATIFPGVAIGDGCIVSAGAVVMSDVPSYTVVAGNPARRIAALTPIQTPSSASPSAEPPVATT